MYSSRRQGGPPSWFIALIGIALVFGGFRLWTGVQEFFQTGGLLRPTASAIALETSAAADGSSGNLQSPLMTRYPTNTPQPTCQDYTVRPGAGVINVRRQPSTVAAVEETLTEGDPVCVLEVQGEWFYIDRDVNTRRIEDGYIFEGLLRASNPTPTPSNTPPAPATITLTPTATATKTPTRTP